MTIANGIKAAAAFSLMLAAAGPSVAQARHGEWGTDRIGRWDDQEVHEGAIMNHGQIPSASKRDLAAIALTAAAMGALMVGTAYAAIRLGIRADDDTK